MSAYLLDINALIALLDSDHAFNQPATQWFFTNPKRHWLSCPITENGTIRIIALPGYPRSQPPHATIESLRTLTTFGRHEQIPDDASLLGSGLTARHIHGTGRVTDSYLALLAQSHGAILATFDRRLSTTAIDGTVEVFQIPT